MAALEVWANLRRNAITPSTVLPSPGLEAGAAGGQQAAKRKVRPPGCCTVGLSWRGLRSQRIPVLPLRAKRQTGLLGYKRPTFGYNGQKPPVLAG